MLWYNAMSAFLDDEEVQKKGTVGIVYAIGNEWPDDELLKTSMNRIQKFANAVPTRAAVCHFLYNNPRLRPLLSVFQMALSGGNNRLRFRAHCGEWYSECRNVRFRIHVVSFFTSD